MTKNLVIDLISRTGIAALLAASLIAGAATAASAAPSEPVVVRVTSAELATPQGLREVALRLNVAAERACGVDQIPIEVRFSDGFRNCRDDAVNRALAQINDPQVATALHRAPQTQQQFASARR
jgi:UrcA family protein